MTAPERMTPQEHEAAMIDRLEALIPLLAGATHYNCGFRPIPASDSD